MALLKFPIKILSFPFRFLGIFEKNIYKIRNAFWDYPNLFTLENPQTRKFYALYKASIPCSHFAVSSMVIIFLFIPLFLTGFPKILSYSQHSLIEAVVTGVDREGNVQIISKINPILPSNVQLEKDLSNLIYEPLLSYSYTDLGNGRQIGGVEYVLAENIITIKSGAIYQFNLKEDVVWHDGAEFNADDVIATFDKISQIDSSDSNSSSNAYTKALKDLYWEKINKYTVKVCTKPVEESEDPCNVGNTNPIFSNFLELLSFKIIPDHLIDDISSSTVNTSDPQLYREPVGTGKFKVDNVKDRFISLSANQNHSTYSKDQNIKEIRFVYYKTQEEAVAAVRNGEAHTLATLSTQYKQDFVDYPQINTFTSPVLYNQFWGLYFNLRTNLDGEPIGPSFLQNTKVRRAISAAINRESLIENALSDVGAEALGPIPSISYYFNKDANWYTFESANSAKVLENEGWTIKGDDQFRTNDKGEIMQFSLYFVENEDRRNVAETIKRDLSKIGIDVLIDRSDQQAGFENDFSGWSLEELNNQILAPRLFDVVLYGMNTFIDPDRYELYHSSQIDYPGLNIAGYISSEKTVDKNPNRGEGESSLIQVPKVDRFLEQARSFEPEKNRVDRKDRYDEIQRIIAEDVPVVYLYHPQFIYFANNSIGNLNLDSVNTLEERFKNVEDWRIGE